MPPWKRGLHNAESELAADIDQDVTLNGGQEMPMKSSRGFVNICGGHVH